MERITQIAYKTNLSDQAYEIGVHSDNVILPVTNATGQRQTLTSMYEDYRQTKQKVKEILQDKSDNAIDSILSLENFEWDRANKQYQMRFAASETDYQRPFTAADTNELINQYFTRNVITRPNLLDNWYFLNPVNQRQQSYNSAWSIGYGIDRWKCDGGCNAELTANGIKLAYASGSTGTEQGFIQVIDNPQAYRNVPLTFSVLGHAVNECIIAISATGTISAGNMAWMGAAEGVSQVTLPAGNYTSIVVSCKPSRADSECTLKAAKLEIGTRSTLCDYEGILIEIPNYATELAKCQRYFIRLQSGGHLNGSGFFNSTTNAHIHIALPTVMRAKASVSVNGTLYIWGTNKIGENSLPCSSQQIDHYNEACALHLNCSVTGATAGSVALPTFRSDNSYIDLSADL